jgi:hypothetical protein
VYPHDPAVHVAAPFVGVVQAVAHAPQLVGSELTLTSHPFDARPSQSRNPGMHAYPHVPAVQVGIALGSIGHAVAHAPQCVGSVLRFDSQPSVAIPLQSPNPEAHVKPHAVPLHVADALAGIGHGEHEAPHVMVLVLSEHIAPHAW